MGLVWERWKCGAIVPSQHREPNADGSKDIRHDEKFRNGLSHPLSFLFLCPIFLFSLLSFPLFSILLLMCYSLYFCLHYFSIPPIILSPLHWCIPWPGFCKMWVPFNNCLYMHGTGNLECFKIVILKLSYCIDISSLDKHIPQEIFILTLENI